MYSNCVSYCACSASMSSAEGFCAHTSTVREKRTEMSQMRAMRNSTAAMPVEVAHGGFH
jgi:hypothetical protein